MTETCGMAGGPEEGAPPAGMRVLVVEDDEFLRTVVEELLGIAGARVAPVEDAEAAAARLEGDPDVELVLTDLHLPGRSGLWLAEWCAERLAGVPVVLTSAALPPGGSVLPASVRGLLCKPFTPDELLRVLGEAVRPAGAGG